MQAFNCHPDFTTRYSIHKIGRRKGWMHQTQSVLRSSGPKYQKLSSDLPMQLNRTQIFGHWPPRRSTKFHDSIENRAAVLCNQPVKLMCYFAKSFCSDFSTNDYGSWVNARISLIISGFIDVGDPFFTGNEGDKTQWWQVEDVDDQCYL